MEVFNFLSLSFHSSLHRVITIVHFLWTIVLLFSYVRHLHYPCLLTTHCSSKALVVIVDVNFLLFRAMIVIPIIHYFVEYAATSACASANYRIFLIHLVILFLLFICSIVVLIALLSLFMCLLLLLLLMLLLKISIVLRVEEKEAHLSEVLLILRAVVILVLEQLRVLLWMHPRLRHLYRLSIARLNPKLIWWDLVVIPNIVALAGIRRIFASFLAVRLWRKFRCCTPFIYPLISYLKARNFIKILIISTANNTYF